MRDDGAEATLSSSEVRQRAASGALLVGLRSVAIRGLGLLSGLVLARLLVPEDFGVLAFGQTLIVFAAFFTDAGIAATLVRRTEPPTRAELSTVLGFQLSVAVVLAVAVAVVAVPLGRSGQVAAVMAASVVLSSCRAPAALVLERRLEYRAIAGVEVAEGLVFVVWSVTAVVLGAGVWGVATAHLGRALIGSLLMIRRTPVRVFDPRMKLRALKEMLRYGLVVQAGGLANLVRAQGINLTTAAVAGLPVLGLYNLADRIIQLPWLVFESALRVTFPAMARLVAGGQDARSDIDRGLRLLTVSAGPLLALVAATAPVLVPTLFGDRWTDSAGALPFICLGLLVAGPLIAVGNGYLFAVGDARKVLWASLSHSAAWAVVAVPLLPSLGPTAVGAGLLAGFTCEAAVLARAVRRRTGLRCVRILALPSLGLAAAAGAGLAVASRLEPSLLAVVGVSAMTTVLIALALLLFARRTLLEARDLARRMLDRRRAA